MKTEKAMKNILFGFGGQLIIVVLGIIVPRIMITNYGSDVNGLLSTISQIFTYMALLEAGIGQAASNAMYKPIAQNDREGFSTVVSVSQRYFRKFTIYYAVGVIILSAFVPFVLKTEVKRSTVALIVLFEGMSGVFNFFFVETQTIILNADGKGYVNNAVNVANKTISYAVKIAMAAFGINIVFLQFVYFLITIAKVIFYKIYFAKKYNWIDYKAASKGLKLKDRNSYIITDVAWTIFSSTDMIVLSTFVSTQLTSVYSVYNMIFNNLNMLVIAVYNSVLYILGHSYHENIKQYEDVHDGFTSVFLGTVTTLMSISYILILPFIRLYTRNVTDVNYINPSLPILFCLVQILSWSRYISGNLTFLSGYAKQVSVVSLIEAFLNLTFSILFVSKLGIVGVLIATVGALPLKVIYCTYLTDHKVLRRSYKKTIKILGINYLFFGMVVFLNRFISLDIASYLDFLKYGVIVSVICGVCGVLLNLIANPKLIKIVDLIHK